MAKYTTPIHTATVMLRNLAVEFGTPSSDSTSREIPISRIKTRNTLQKRTYSDKGLPKIVITVSFRKMPSRHSLFSILGQTGDLHDRTDFDRAPTGSGNPLGNIHRRIKIRGVDEIVATKLFTGL